MDLPIRRSSHPWQQLGTQTSSTHITVEDRQPDAFCSAHSGGTVSAQNGSTYSGANQTQDGNIVQVGNINANIVQIAREVPSIDVLRWLYASSYDSKHKKTRRERVKGSGAWLLKKQEYQEWYSDTSSTQLLWCHGKPGVGKTFIASAVIDELLANHMERDIGVAYIYLDYADKEAQTLENVFASVLKQIAICKEKESIEEVRRLYRACNMGAQRPEIDALVETVGQMSRHFKQIFIVIDALDECSDKLRTVLLKQLESLDDPRWRFFITGRSHLWDVSMKFPSCSELIIVAHRDDVEKLVLERIRDEPGLAELFEDNSLLEETVVSKIIERANEMFLLVTLMLNSIASSTCESDIEDLLEQMPVDLSHSYEKTLERIRDQHPKKVDLSYRILWWLSRARRPLSYEELAHAVAVRDRDCGRNPKKESKQGIMTTACMGLVFVDDERNFRLVHFSTQEYLLAHFSQSSMKQILREEDIIARACLTILMYDEFESGPCETYAAAKKLYENCPMLLYAAEYWHDHLAETISKDLNNLSMRFLYSSRKLRASRQTRQLCNEGYLRLRDRQWCWFSPEAKYTAPQYTLTTALHLTSMLGMVHHVQQLLQESDIDVNATDDDLQTPLALAVRNNRARIVELLLRVESIDCEEKDDFGRTPFLIAAELDDTDIMKQLLARGVMVQKRDNEYKNALHISAKAPHDDNTDVVELLIASGVEINARCMKNMTPLHTAVQASKSKIVEVLLSNGADACAADIDGFTPIFSAARRDLIITQTLHQAGADIHSLCDAQYAILSNAVAGCQHETVEWLLSLGADPCTADKEGATPLHIAAVVGHLAIAQALHRAGADIHALSNTQCSVLRSAAAHGQCEIVEWLLSLGADPSVAEKDGWTALHGAATIDLATTQALHRAGADIHALSNTKVNIIASATVLGQCEIAEWLLSLGADLSITNEDGWTPLLLAAEKDLATVKVLYRAGADMSTRTHQGRTVLHIAANNGQYEMVEWLLSLGADPSVADKEGWMPLHLAATADLATAKLLYQAGADMSTRTHRGLTVLHIAANNGQYEMVEWLLSLGADPSVADKEGWMPLHLAATADLATAKLLYQAGADVNAYDDQGCTVLRIAANEGQREIVEWLLSLGADPCATDKNGWTPIHSAAAKDLETTKLLQKAGADIYARTKFGWTVLRAAADHKRAEIVAWLVSMDTGSLISDEHALVVAAKAGAKKTVAVLLNRGVDVNAHDKFYGNALQQACEGGYVDVVELLLDRGADANQESLPYGLPFFAAAFRGHLHILRLLVGRDAACINSTDKLGRNALHFAARSGSLASVEFLLSKGVDINTVDIKGNTVLHHAACADSRLMIKYLLDHGFTVPKSSGSWSPLHWAYRTASKDVINLLNTMYSNEEVVQTVHPAGLWTPSSIGLYHRNTKLDQLSQNSPPKVLTTDEGVISNKKAEKCGTSICDECFLKIFGLRFACLICIDFDLCLMCKLTGDKSHPPHGWKVFEYRQDRHVEVDIADL